MPGENTRSFGEFEREVYKQIIFLENFERMEKVSFVTRERGCFGLFINYALSPLLGKATMAYREKMKIDELNLKAAEILSSDEIKKSLCAKLNKTNVLAPDIAYEITPVLYELAVKDDAQIPLDTTLFAIISRKIAARGIPAYCG